jgi:hypothetical protein
MFYTEGKDEQTIREPSYKQLEVKTNKQYMSPPTNNWRGGLMYCLFVFTSSCL